MTYSVRFGNRLRPIPTDDFGWSQLQSDIAARVAAVIQNDSICLLLGSGFTHSVAASAGTDATGMSLASDLDRLKHGDRVAASATQSALASGRGEANLEDQLNTAMALAEGLRISGDPATPEWDAWIADTLRVLGESILRTEHDLLSADAMRDAAAFLSIFAARPPSRDRLHIFTTNYDRVIEFAADNAGIRLLDRFVGAIRPVLRTSRANLDYIWNPPGLRGEPRFVEGVARFTKLHGSIDWQDSGQEIVRVPLGFGEANPEVPFGQRMMVYPNSAKDRALREFPYSELFRDFASSVVRSQTALVTFGYGFGDAHVNAVISDALRLPSTLLLVISFDDPGGRIERFVEGEGVHAQVTTLIGPDFGNLSALVARYLPLMPEDTVATRVRARKISTDSESNPPREVDLEDELAARQDDVR